SKTGTDSTPERPGSGGWVSHPKRQTLRTAVSSPTRQALNPISVSNLPSHWGQHFTLIMDWQTIF
ncbi:MULTISPECIES: hypothetical protein, partial [unclassified Roseobacter]|uniref:hypothetical protein n=1 Tax=unclassified Roseobacter TaxID=196798 RepID=UPI001C0EB2D1